ncbi:MAG: monooxygenase [Gemmataceae bacterium]
MSRTDAPRIAILGAGPVGLEAALYAASLKLPFRVYERGKAGDNLRRWGHVKLFTPFGMNATPLGRATLRADKHKLPGDQDLLTGREHLAAYLDPLAKCSLLAGRVETDTAVVCVGRKGHLKEESPPENRRAASPFRLLLRGEKGQERVEESEVVLDCTGTYGNGRYLGDGGIPAVGELAARPNIACGLEDILGEKAAHYADRTTLVVGAGFSAATSVVLLAELAKKHPSTWIVWLARSTGSQPIKRLMSDPLRERDLLAAKANMLATRGEGHVEFHAGSVLDLVEPAKDGFTVKARVGGVARSWSVDRVIANVGYEPDPRLYRELQVHECYASLGPMRLAAALARHAGGDCLTVGSQGASTLQNPEPNFYILGMKSYGRASNFLMRTGFEQVREAFTLMIGKPDLDLYRAAR